MGRKSLANERRDEILDAFERCIVRYGLDGTSLEQIAAEAGVQRSLIRHYLGNRDALINELIDRFTQKYLRQAEEALQGITDPTALIPALLNYLFSAEVEYTRDEIVMDVLMTASERFPIARQSLARMFEKWIDQLAASLALVYPAAAAGQQRKVAYAILCLCITNEVFMWLGLKRTYNRAARESAEALLRTLEGG